MNLPFQVLEKRMLPLGFVRGMDVNTGTFAGLLEDIGSISGNTKQQYFVCVI